MSRVAAAMARIIDPFAPAHGAPPQRPLSFARWALTGAGPALTITFVITVMSGLSEMAVAWFTGLAIDTATAVGPAAFVSGYWPMILGGVLFFLVFRPVIFAADAGVTSMLLAPHLFPLVLSRINRHTMGQSMRFFEDDFAGRISQKAMQTARSLTDVVIEILDVGVYALAMFAGALVLMAGIDGRLVAILGLWAVFYAAALAWFIPRVRARAAGRAGARTAVTGQIVDTLSNMATVKLFAHDAHEERATLAALDLFREKSLHYGVMTASFRLVLMALGGLLPLLSILGSLWLWSRGLATAGEIALASMVATRLSQITNRLGFAAIGIFGNIGELEDGIATLARPHEITDRPGAQDRPATRGAIAFEQVRFAYGGPVAALRGFDLTIAPGEKVALVGASGAGKTTATALLLRLYDVEGGRIRLDGVDIRDMTQEALRRSIAVVRQETAMFNRSARDNIRYGRPDATEDQIIDAARRAEAHEFITELVDHRGRRGYDARLGERGVKLSGGQRQRIALARALLKDAPVLILDEATSALDSEVESRIQAALTQAMEGRTVLAIAHRLSTVAHMDRIVVLDQGRIVETGRHGDLLAAGGRYAGFWTRQSGGFLGDQA